MRELPAGHDAVLLDFSDHEVPWRGAVRAAQRLRAAMAAGALPAVIDVIPAAQTVLVQAESGAGLDRLGVRRALRDTPAEDADGFEVGQTVSIAVAYEGADLPEVAQAIGCSVNDVISAHSQLTWRVQFVGFAPGFGYLVPDTSPPTGSAAAALCSLGRRATARPSVPAGSVAVAAGYSAVYPRESPGGWNLLGHRVIRTGDEPLWDVTAQPPALLGPGRTVRFEPC
ncbi:allophanate hydrolase subunit 1 [Williamsia sp. CHRR-6]|uniref:5-oxoprolinase subunit B family protein n=1 Tax=Williamsia sp. CHRR-6 TaxID=2835871 RepID=UPI001BDB5417|nr:carboxyltransferase domain-containing protein [Williamsia sp. CHRR-6]MBT0566433.1 carboxyltransferase domain-containing protein [Williamsia sp. CHRR-6]